MEKLKILTFCRKYGISAQYIYDILPDLRHIGPKYINKADVTVELVEEVMSDKQTTRFLIIHKGNIYEQQN